MLALLIADAVGVDPKRVNYIAFAGAGESNPAVLGGQVSVGLSPLSTVAPHIEAGTVRVLGISSAERIPSLDAPTLREQGVDVEFESWRSLFAPPGVSVADRQRLEVGRRSDGAIDRMAGHPRALWMERSVSHWAGVRPLSRSRRGARAGGCPQTRQWRD